MSYYSTKYSMNFLKIKENPNNVIKPDLDFYEKILRIQSPSNNEGNMIRFIINHVKKNFPDAKVEQDKQGNLYVTKGVIPEGTHYPCLVAHLDEVHDFNPNREIYRLGEFYIGWDKQTGEREGIGADDKNGIFISLTMLEKFDNIKLFFPVQEEVGLIGTYNCDLKWFNDVGYMMQCDRRGYSDLISYTNGVDVASFDFLLDIDDIVELYNYNDASGTCTDIGGLVKQNVGVSACNISCGYWDEHSEDELTYIPALSNCMNFVYHILKQCGNKKYEHSIENPKDTGYSYTGGRGYNYHDDWYDDEEAAYAEYLKKPSNYTSKDIDPDDLPDNAEDYPCLHCRDQDCMNCTKYS